MIIFLFILQTYQLRFNITTPEGNPSEFITLQTYQTVKLKVEIGNYQLNQEKILLYITDDISHEITKSCTLKLMNRQVGELKIYVNATNTEEKSILTSIAISAIIISPARGILTQPNLFPIILSQKLIESYMMPFNLPTNKIYNLDIINDDLEKPPQNLTPFGQEFWQEYQEKDISIIALTWIPFMGNCKDQGYYLYFYNLLENATFCNLVAQEDTKVVNMVPTNGFNAKGDSCNINLECYFLENLMIEYEGNKWWQSEQDSLFYISKYALNYKILAENSDDSKTNYFYNMIQAQDESLIAVQFITSGVIKNSYPTEFTLQILYNQISQTEKQIVSAIITASNYQKVTSIINKYTFNIVYRPMDYLELINSFQFDITLYLVLYLVIGILINIGIFVIWVINKSISIIPDPPKLRIYQTFIVAFLPPITGVIRATIPIIIYVLILDNLFAPDLFSGITYNYDGLSTDFDNEQQYQKGRVGLMLVVSGIIIMKIACKLCIPKPIDEDWGIIRSNIEKKNEEKYYDFSISEEESKESPMKQDEIREAQVTSKNVENNLQSNSISRQGSLFSKQQPIPGSAPPMTKEKEPTMPKNSLFKKATILKQSSSIKDNQSLKDSISPVQLLQRQNSSGNPIDKKQSIFNQAQQSQQPQINQNQQADEEDIIDKLKDSLISKDYHYQLICIMIAALLLFFLGFSYEQLFYKNIYYFLIVLQFIESFVYWLLSEYLLEEQTLIQPLMACLEVVQFIMFMAAESFQEFVISFVIRLSLIIVFRTYINPVIRNFKHFKKKLMNFMNKWQPFFSLESEQEKQPEDNISFYLGQHTDSKFTEDQSIEYVIQMTLGFSSKVHAIFIKPIVLVFIKLFEKESQITNNYYIGFREFNYYIYFAFFVIIPQIFIDIYVLNSLEMIYGFKLFDYFDYCKYRNDFRIQKFFEHSLTYDRSIDAQYRSIDNMKFTDQFYYNGSLVIYSILLCILGTTIMIRNNYVLYQDPAIFLIILFIYIFITLLQNMMLYIWNKIDVWKIKDTKQKLNLDSLEEFLNPAKENIEQIIEVDAFKKHFIKLNKDWLVSNLELFINVDQFTQHDEFLLQTYQLLLNDERKAQKEIIRNEQMIKKQKELELKSKKKRRKTSQSQSIIKSQRDIEEIDGYQHTIRIKRSQVENLRKILSIWYYKAKQTLFLKYLVSDVLAQNQAEHCKRCGLDIELRVVELIPFEKMSNQFKYRIMGTPFNKFEWIKYYETHQKFVTLCIDCENAYKSRFLQRQNQSANDVAKLASQNFVAKAFVFKWLYAARARMLHKKSQTVEKLTY
ncbi:unnamed protein product [Paramecium pentaurelia]|uniref:Transmembrane protein n=1 Tax=Paramecium pentaurelia TaxID=43138 RepID=A0A8S1XIW2_9CILI|nr:unnamed protein product [Paramecium pentaurelia]